jgi:gamma-glutamyltranspeptidase/glutathione hydrolase
VGDTTYLCAVDGDGMAVSLIQSNASGFGSHLFEPATGINLHNRGLGFSLEPGTRLSTAQAAGHRTRSRRRS